MAVKCKLGPSPALDPNGSPLYDRHSKVAIVAPNFHVGELLMRKYADKPWIKVIWPCSALTGHRFDIVVISGEVMNDIERGAPESHRQWWNEHVRCRLSYNGQIIVIP